MKSFLYIFNKSILLCLVFATTVFSQSITNTLGIGGKFKIKDASNDYFILSQSNGDISILRSLRLENTTSSSIGVLFKGPDRFLHNFGNDNLFMGVNSGNFTMTGGNNSALGANSLFSNTSGSNNTAVGLYSMYFNTVGTSNTALGLSSLTSNTTGNNNTAVGVNSLLSNNSGIENTAIGFNSLYLNTTGVNNTAVGNLSLFTNQGSHNTAIGHSSLFSNMYGHANTALGFSSLFTNDNGYGNTAIGYNSMHLNVSGDGNTAIGLSSLYNSSGDGNTAIGGSSLYNNLYGHNNTAIGIYSGTNITSGNNNTTIGQGAIVPDGSLSNQVRIGNTDINYAGVQVAWTITSDIRWKSNILNSNLGLNFISKLNPVSYTRNNDERHKTEYGFIAQDVEEVLKESGIDNSGMINIDDKGNYEMRYNDLLAPMVKAIQELKDENDVLKNENKEMKRNNDMLSSEVEELKIMNEKILILEKRVNQLNSLKHTNYEIEREHLSDSNIGEEK